MALDLVTNSWLLYRLAKIGGKYELKIFNSFSITERMDLIAVQSMVKAIGMTAIPLRHRVLIRPLGPLGTSGHLLNLADSRTL